MSVQNLNKIKHGEIRNIEEIELILKETTIFDKIAFSDITKEAIREKIQYLEKVQVPNRTVLLNMKDEDVVEYWFKNWLHPSLKHAVKKAPTDKRGCSSKSLENDSRRNFLNCYENGQQNYTYNLNDIKNWLNS